jgi:ATP synthase protein I
VISQRPNLTTSRAFCLNCAPALRESPYSGTRLSGSRTMLQSQDPFYAGLGQAIRIGTELLAALIVGVGSDGPSTRISLDTGPWVMVVGLMCGCAGRRQKCLSHGAAVAEVVRLMHRERIHGRKSPASV